MWQFIKDVFRFLRRLDSESACLLIISTSVCLTKRDIKQMADYHHALWEAECEPCQGEFTVSAIDAVELKCRKCGETHLVKTTDFGQALHVLKCWKKS